MALQIGESIGHYQIVEELGVGGNGRVLKVEHLITRRREAMKILPNGRPNSQEYEHRVLREIRLQASLDHPNIAAVLNAFWLEDDLAMIMELIDGETLQKVLERRRLNLDQSLKLIRQVLLALSYAHAKGVIHRDVSTANIIVGDDMRIKLTDFGLAKGSADLSVTQSGGMIGSPYYISPEQVRGTAATDQRSDIYSTGIVLYELLTGTKPFEAESSFLLMQAHVQSRPQSPIERNAAIPQFINEAILKALAKNPEDRFQTTAEFLSAIDGPSEIPRSKPEAISNSSTATSSTLSHFYAALNFAKNEANSWKHSEALRRRISSPARGAMFGIAVVLAVVAPVVIYGFVSGRSRVVAVPKSLPAIQVPVAVLPDLKTEAPAEKIELTAGPKELPTLPQGNGGTIIRKNSVPKRPLSPPAPASVPRPVVVWGDAKASARASARPVQTGPAIRATTALVPAVEAPRKMIEEPPILSSSQPKAIIQLSMPEPVGTAPRKGIFRRFANGVKALNPVKRAISTPSSAISPGPPSTWKP